jgi:hypothetical protein
LQKILDFLKELPQDSRQLPPLLLSPPLMPAHTQLHNIQLPPRLKQPLTGTALLLSPPPLISTHTQPHHIQQPPHLK